MQSLPIFVSLKNKLVVVIGGGDVALRKVQSLLKAGADVEVISHEICPQIRALECDQLKLTIGDYHADAITHAWLVIAATDDDGLNEQVQKDALAIKTFVNVVDDPQCCHFIFPAIIDRSPIVIAISSGGKAPVLARLWKEKLEAQIPQWTGRLAALAGSYREKVKQTYKDFKQRRHFWERFFRGEIASAASQDNWSQVETILDNALVNKQTETGAKYEVSYGDGNPENLTLKALQLMQLADVIVYQQDTPEAIMDLCRKDADKTTNIDEVEANDIVVVLKPSVLSGWRQI